MTCDVTDHCHRTPRLVVLLNKMLVGSELRHRTAAPSLERGQATWQHEEEFWTFDLDCQPSSFLRVGDSSQASSLCVPGCARHETSGWSGAEPSDRCVVGRAGFWNIRGVRHAARLVLKAPYRSSLSCGPRGRLLNLIGSLMVTCAWRGARVLGLYSVADALLAAHRVRTVSLFFFFLVACSTAFYFWTAT
jgi:hypothetical protein